MDSGYLPRHEHEEFVKRMEEEHKRQNRRIQDVEAGMKENNRLLVTIERIAICTENIEKEQQAQGQRLEKQGEKIEALENRDGEKWRKAEWAVISCIITGVIGYFVGQLL